MDEFKDLEKKLDGDAEDSISDLKEELVDSLDETEGDTIEKADADLDEVGKVMLKSSPKIQEAKKSSPTVAKQKGNKQSEGVFDRFIKAFKEVAAEFNKVVWPNNRELTKMTITVIITSLLFGVVITGFDVVFSFVVGILVDLV